MQSSYSADGGSATEPAEDLQQIVNGVRVVRWNPTRTDQATGAVSPVANFGDLLGPIVVDALSSQLPAPAEPESVPRLVAVGSLLHFARKGDVIWGAGVNGKIKPSAIPLTELDIRAVRGPRTRLILRELGYNVPAVYGDPAMLLPRIAPITADWAKNKSRPITIVPNLNDLTEELAVDPRVVSPRGELWDVIRAIAESEFVVGSSLHAIVVAEALGIPARLVASTNENYFKYVDYYAGTRRSRVAIGETVDEAISLGGVAAGEVDLDGILESFPADLWTGYSEPSAEDAALPGADVVLGAVRDAIEMAWDSRRFGAHSPEQLADFFEREIAAPLYSDAAQLSVDALEAYVDLGAEYLREFDLLEPDVSIGAKDAWIAKDYPVLRRAAVIRARGSVAEVAGVTADAAGVTLAGLYLAPSTEPDLTRMGFELGGHDGTFVPAAAASFTAIAEDSSVFDWSLSIPSAVIDDLPDGEWVLTFATDVDGGVERVAVRERYGVRLAPDTLPVGHMISCGSNADGSFTLSISHQRQVSS